MSKMPVTALSAPQIVKELEKAVSERMRIIYPNANVKAMLVKVRDEPLNPPALLVEVTARFQVTELDKKETPTE